MHESLDSLKVEIVFQPKHPIGAKGTTSPFRGNSLPRQAVDEVLKRDPERQINLASLRYGVSFEVIFSIIGERTFGFTVRMETSRQDGSDPAIFSYSAECGLDPLSVPSPSDRDVKGRTIGLFGPLNGGRLFRNP